MRDLSPLPYIGHRRLIYGKLIKTIICSWRRRSFTWEWKVSRKNSRVSRKQNKIYCKLHGATLIDCKVVPILPNRSLLKGMTADQRSSKKNKKRVSKNLLTKIDKYREKWYVYLSGFFARVLSEYYGSRGEFNNIKNDVCKVGLLGL